MPLGFLDAIKYGTEMYAAAANLTSAITGEFVGIGNVLPNTFIWPKSVEDVAFRACVFAELTTRQQKTVSGLAHKAIGVVDDETFKDTTLVLAFDDTKPIGVIVCAEQVYGGQSAAYIRGGTVDKRYRRQGIGKKLLGVAEAVLADQGYDAVFCITENPVVKRLPETGFVASGNDTFSKQLPHTV